MDEGVPLVQLRLSKMDPSNTLQGTTFGHTYMEYGL